MGPVLGNRGLVRGARVSCGGPAASSTATPEGREWHKVARGHRMLPELAVWREPGLLLDEEHREGGSPSHYHHHRHCHHHHILRTAAPASLGTLGSRDDAR